MSDPTELWFDATGIRIHGLDWGGPSHGSLVLLLHGVGGNAWIWGDVAPRLRAALPGHRIVAIDQRDGGDTDHPPDDYTREAFTADVVAVARAITDRPISLVGHSRGGWLAGWIAAVEPELVGRLVLVDPARLSFADEGAADTFFAWVEGSLGPFDDAEAAIRWAAAQDRHAAWTAVRRRSFLAGLRTDEDGRLVGKLPRSVVERLKDARRDAAAVTAAVADLGVPTLLLVADRQSPERRADKLRYAELIRDVTTVTIDASHFIHTDAPGAVADAIAAFLSTASEPD